MGSGGSSQIQPNNFFRDLSPDQLYFIQNWLKDFDWARQRNYLKGFQLNPADPNYDYPLAMATGSRPVAVLDDAGAPHWSSKTPAGQWLKSETHPTHWAEDYAVLQDALKRAFLTQ